MENVTIGELLDYENFTCEIILNCPLDQSYTLYEQTFEGNEFTLLFTKASLEPSFYQARFVVPWELGRTDTINVYLKAINENKETEEVATHQAVGISYERPFKIKKSLFA